MNTAFFARRFRAAAGLCLAGLALSAAPASADSVSATTNLGGSCRIVTTATPATGITHEVTYGVEVPRCRAHYGIRNADAASTLYDYQGLVISTVDWLPGDVPYAKAGEFSSLADEPVLSRSTVTVVLKARKGPRTRKPERWREHEPNCRIATTRVSSDSLKCTLVDPV